MKHFYNLNKVPTLNMNYFVTEKPESRRMKDLSIHPIEQQMREGKNAWALVKIGSADAAKVAAWPLEKEIVTHEIP